MNLILLFLSIVLVNNVITSQFMGICPFLGVSKKVDTAIGMGVAVTFVLTLASFITYFVQKLLEITRKNLVQPFGMWRSHVRIVSLGPKPL